MIPCAHPAVDIGLVFLLHCESLTVMNHILYGVTSPWLLVHLQSECKQLLPRSPRSVLNPCSVLCEMPHWKMRSVPTDTGWHLPLPLMPTCSVTFTEASPVFHSESSPPSPTTPPRLVCGIAHATLCDVADLPSHPRLQFPWRQTITFSSPVDRIPQTLPLPIIANCDLGVSVMPGSSCVSSHVILSANLWVAHTVLTSFTPKETVIQKLKIMYPKS